MRKPIKTVYKNRLPHIAPIGATFFCTFRLHDCLPRTIIKQLEEKLAEEIRMIKSTVKGDWNLPIINAKKRIFKKYEHQMDELPYGACYLKNPKVAEIVKTKIHEFDQKYYTLIAYCIMSNHVHLIFDTSFQLKGDDGKYLKEVPESYAQLHQIMKRMKGSTARYANLELKRSGKFWMIDGYDHYIRNEKEYGNIVRYILNNPVKAKMVRNWKIFPHTYVAPGILNRIGGI